MNNLNLSRRTFLEKTAAAGAAAVLKTRSVNAETTQNELTLKDKSILMVQGGWKGHQPEQCAEIFAPWAKSLGAEVILSDTLDAYLDQNIMKDIDLIIQIWTMGKISKDQEKALLRAVESGAGIAGWHGGLGDSFRESTKYQFMIGGQWVAHPGGVIDYQVDIVNSHDPVTKGISGFRMHSEQYYMHVDPNVKVLATTTFSDDHSFWIKGCVVPVIWKKMYGKGRVFYSSLGHVADDFKVPEALETMKRGILWASESKKGPHEKWIHPVYS